uniref:Uncharacterized protein n=1 Tax=Oryza glumipatula TaxID=40148 RepID=A0A0E0BS74_9ORYZ
MTPLPPQHLLARSCRCYSTCYGRRYASHHLPTNRALAAAVCLLSSQIMSSHPSPTGAEVGDPFLPSYSDVKRICLPSCPVLFLNLRGSVLSRCCSAGRGGACSSFNLSGTVQFADTKHFNVVHSSYSFSAGGHLFLPFCLLQWIAPLEAPNQIQRNEQAVTCYLWIWEDLDKYVEEMVAYSRTGKYDYLRETVIRDEKKQNTMLSRLLDVEESQLRLRRDEVNQAKTQLAEMKKMFQAEKSQRHCFLFSCNVYVCLSLVVGRN